MITQDRCFFTDGDPFFEGDEANEMCDEELSSYLEECHRSDCALTLLLWEEAEQLRVLDELNRLPSAAELAIITSEEIAGYENRKSNPWDYMTEKEQEAALEEVLHMI